MSEDIYLKLKYALSPVDFIHDLIWKPMHYQMKPFHKEWIEFINNERYVVLLAPRGHSKTVSLCSYLIWKIVTNPNIRILLVSISRDKSFEIMNFIQQQLETNEHIIELFGEQKSDKTWTKLELRVKNQGVGGKILREPTLTCVGVDSEVIGGHYDIICLDDVVSPTNSRTEYQRMNLRNWFFNVIMPMLEPDGKIIVTGTKWYKTDLYYTLMNVSRFKIKVYKAIIDDEKKQVLWEERFPYEELKRKEQEGRINFYLQYQNEILSDEYSIIKDDWIRYYTEIPANIKRYIGVDLSAASGEEGDYFAIIVIGVDDYGNIYVLDRFRDRITLSKQIDIIYNFYDKWSPIAIGIEANAMQKLIKDYIQQTTLLPIKPVKTSIDKISRISKISVYFETNRVFFNPQLVDVIDELLEFPRGEYDDCCDALAFAIEVALQNKPRDWESMLNVLKTWNKQVVKI